MKIEQKATFVPIKIILETKEEAETFWQLVLEVDASTTQGRKMAQAMSDIFSNRLKL